MKRKDQLIIWPQYFDKNMPRNKGRKVPKKFAVDSPNLTDIINIATKLRLNFEIDYDSRYPSLWWKNSGRLLIKKTIPKYALIKRMSTMLKKSG